MDIKWLIYCRVSSKKQVKEWNWLSSQEKRCRDYATGSLWIQVEKVFNDEWVSGWLFERKSIQELFKYIDKNKKNNYIVIFEDLNRLSRDIQVHTLLKSEFKKRWVELACPNFKFEESPEWDFKENISVIVSQYEKDKNKQRVLSRMKARLEQWFWCFRVPIWYKFIEANEWWRIVVKDTEIANTIKNWLEKYADWKLQTLHELQRFYFKKWLNIKWTSTNWRIVSTSNVHWITTNIFYTGNLVCEKWDIPITKAKHEALISMKTYERIQKRLKSMSPVERKIESSINRKDISDDFPLRWHLYCEDSWYMLSWWWATWRNRKVPYYTFPRNSPLKWKSINRDKFHSEFDEILKTLTPKKDTIKCFEEIFIDLLKDRKDIFTQNHNKLEREISDIDKKIDNFIDRIWNTSSQKLVENYEWKIEILEKDKEVLSEKMTKKFWHLKNVWTSLKDKLKKISNALVVWNSQNVENKKNLIKMIFPSWIPINKKRVVWTLNLSLIYQAFELSKVSKNQMVELDGFEPTSLKARETFLLSYFILIIKWI